MPLRQPLFKPMIPFDITCNLILSTENVPPSSDPLASIMSTQKVGRTPTRVGWMDGSSETNALSTDVQHLHWFWKVSSKADDAHEREARRTEGCLLQALRITVRLIGTHTMMALFVWQVCHITAHKGTYHQCTMG